MKPKDWFVLVMFIFATGVFVYLAARHEAELPVVVCENGSFEPVTDPNDPYLRERATCNMGSATGRPVTVLLID